MTSLEIINEIIKDYEESYKNYCNRLELEENKTVSEKESQEFAIQLSYFEKIKQDLEILQILIKWKEFINIEQDYEYLLNDEIKLFDSDIKLLNTYLRHHINSYIPISFRKVGDSQ